jgi:hypothetical protein
MHWLWHFLIFVGAGLAAILANSYLGISNMLNSVSGL